MPARTSKSGSGGDLEDQLLHGSRRAKSKKDSTAISGMRACLSAGKGDSCRQK